MKKQCRKCKTSKDLESFSNRSDSKDGKDIYCKVCKKEYTQRWITKNPEKNKKSSNVSNKNWYLRNKEKKKTTNKMWKSKKAEYTKTWFKEYKKKRELEDISFKLCNKIRSRVWSAVQNNQKVGSAIKDLGCSIEELKKHLESQFQPGMTWDNWSKDGWHIDHIVPLSAFDLSNPEQFKKACHYTNLQPLWAKENLSKGSKLPEDI